MRGLRQCARPVARFLAAPAAALALLACATSALPFKRDDNDYCSNGPNRYFCSQDCNSFYYCNGKARGKDVRCPTGTKCKKLGPHRKYFDTDEQDNFDNVDVTYACEKETDLDARGAKCWFSEPRGPCEIKNDQDQTCSGGGYCRSPTNCSGSNNTRPCDYDTTSGNCQCIQSILPNSITNLQDGDFDPTFSNNNSLVSTEGRWCSEVVPGIREQCNPPMDVIFVMDSSASIVTGGGPDGNREYAKARAFVKKFTSFFVLSPTETKVGYVSFSGDVTIVDGDGNQKCANSLTLNWIIGDSPKLAIDIDALQCAEAVEGDLKHVLLDDPTKVARSIDQKMQRGGTKMFLGMALARRVLEQEKRKGRQQIVVLTTDGSDNFEPELRAQAQKLKDAGVRVLTIAAGAVVADAKSGEPGAVASLAALRDAASRASDYQQLITTAVVKIVKENCEGVTSIEPDLICAEQSTTLVAKGAGFGGQKPPADRLKFKIGDQLFKGVCHEGLGVLTVRGEKMGNGPNGDKINNNMTCTFGVYAVPAKWVDKNTAECIIPPMNCSSQSEFCEVSKKPPNPDWKGPPPSADAPHHRISVPFNFSLNGGLNWYPLNETMQTFHYEPCLPECNYDNTIPPIPLILLLLSLLLCCLPPMALLIGDKTPIKMPELRNMPEPEEPPPLVFGTETVTVKKKVKRVKETKGPVKKKKKKEKPEKAKKKWDVVAAGQYLRGGKHMAVGWGKYGEAEHGEEILDGFETSSSDSDDNIDWDLEAEKQFELAFDEYEEQVQMPQDPAHVEMPRISSIEGIVIDVEAELTLSQKFGEFFKDWRWKWWLLLFLVLVLMAISAWLLIEEHKRLEEEINSRTYGLSDPGSFSLNRFYLNLDMSALLLSELMN
eukprot:g205.t1